MNVTEISQLIEQIIIKRTGKPLNNVQKAIIEGSWQGKSYQQIGKEYHRSESHIRDEGAKLWKLLSDALGEKIKKSNFKRVYIKSLTNSNVYNINGDNNYTCPIENINSSAQRQEDIESQSKSNYIYHGLSLDYETTDFCDRETELEKLYHWIFNHNTRLIAVSGLWGIGKTTLVKRFIELHKQQFDVIIWRSLSFPNSLHVLLDDILDICQENYSKNEEEKLSKFVNLLTHKKCLVILDDVHNLFAVGYFTGHYKPEYSDYQHLFKLITEIQHQSHLIVISQEKFIDMHCLNLEKYPVQCLELLGLETIEIFRNKGLEDENSWLKLIQLYEGNPAYLYDIAMLVKDIFGGKVTDFLAENSLVISKKMQFQFKQLFDRCSPIEETIGLELSKVNEALYREELKNNLSLSSSDLINGLQSLQQRYLVTKIEREQILFKLSPVFKEYIESYCKIL